MAKSRTHGRLSGETALITGTTSGIGRELARVFAENGSNLVLVSRNQARLEAQSKEIAEQYGVVVNTIAIDLTKPDASKAVFDEVTRLRLRIDYLVNNAGFNVCGPFIGTPMADESRMMQLHMLALTELTKLFALEMVKTRKGRILNLGSTGSFAPCPLDAVYAATKAYVLSFSKAIASELEGTGVTVTALCPGATRTEFPVKAGLQDAKLFRYFVMEPDTVARIGFKGMMRGKTVVVAGLYNRILVASIPWTPSSVLSALSKLLLAKPSSAMM